MYPGENLDQGGLSGAIVAQECVHFAGVDIHGNPVQRREVAEALDDVVEPDEGLGHVIYPR